MKIDFVHNKIDEKLMKSNVRDAVNVLIKSLKDEVLNL